MAVQVVSFRCVLKDKLGRVISSTINQNVLTSSVGDSNHLAALMGHLQDLQAGEFRKIDLRADEAYGFYNPKLVLVRPWEDLNFSSPLRLGERVIYETEEGRKSFRVTEMTHDSVTLDANHPLAGQDLVFEIEATAARLATPDEIHASATDDGALNQLH